MLKISRFAYFVVNLDKINNLVLEILEVLQCPLVRKYVI